MIPIGYTGPAWVCVKSYGGHYEVAQVEIEKATAKLAKVVKRPRGIYKERFDREAEVFPTEGAARITAAAGCVTYWDEQLQLHDGFNQQPGEILAINLSSKTNYQGEM